MKVNFSITQDNGSPVLDKVTGQPHAFSFDFAPEALAMVEDWNERQGNKYPNIAEIAREVLFSSFKAMVPQEVVEAFEEQKAEIEKAKEATFWSFFGMTPPK